MAELNSTVGQIVRKMEQDDMIGETTISKYVVFNLRETIETIDAYLNSKHISGKIDSQGREKPFFNIVTAARNIWYRATDIDRKNIKIRATKKANILFSFVATILLAQWMRKINFGKWLNNWGRTLSTYGSAISKFVEKDGDLYCSVISWNRVLCDAVDFDKNLKVERYWLTVAEIKEKVITSGWDEQMVNSLLDTLEARETSDGQKKDNKAEYIEIFEAHGKVPKSYRTGMDADRNTYEQQMFILAYMANKEATKNADIPQFDDFILYSGKEAKDPYDITHLIEEDGRTLSIGAVEHLFEAQWMMNHTTKSIKDQLDLASKLIFQTSDGNFIGQNALTAIESGDILLHQVNQPLTQLANNSHDIASLQSFGNQWKQLGNEINGIAESMINQAKSGTAWRQTQAELQEAHSLFELMVENKSLALENIITRHIIPFIKKKLDTSEELSEILSESQIKKIDSMYIPNKAIKISNKRNVEKILNGELVTPEEQANEIAELELEVGNGLKEMGNQRFIKPSDIDSKTWKEALKDIEWDVEIDTTGEQRDTMGVMETLKSVLSVVAGLNGQPMSEETKIVFNKILELTGAISPLEMQFEQKPVEQPMMAGQQPVSQEQITNIK